MPLLLAQLLTALTPAQVLASLYAIADALGLATTAWQKLSPLRTFFAIVAQLFAGFSSTQATANAQAFLETASGDWLTLRAYYVYGVTRIPATFAPGFETITNHGGGLYEYGPGDLVLLNSTTGKTYVNTGDVTVPPLAGMGGSNPPAVTFAIEALEQGSASTAAPGQIDAFVAASPQLTCTNAASIIGEDAEKDPQLRVRCLLKLGALSPMGPSKAYAFVALTPSLNGGVAISRCLVRPAEGNGTIRVVVASPDGIVSGTYSDPTTDLGKVFLSLNLLAVPAGYTLLLSSAAAHNISPDATLYVSTSSGLSSSDAIAAALAALVAYTPTIPIGGVDVGAGGVVLYRALEAAMLAGATGILEVKLTSEADIAMAATDVAVLSPSPTLTVQSVST